MALNLLPSPAPPVTAERGCAELVAIWHALSPDGRRLLLSHARGVAEVTGRVPRPERVMVR